jgi:hypothetical protein
VIIHIVHMYLITYSTEYNDVTCVHDPFYEGFSVVQSDLKYNRCVQSYR